MTVQLFELALAEDKRLFSPACFRVRLALCQKGIPFQSIVHHYADKQEIAPFDQWPVLEHNGKRMDESLDIIGKRDQALLAGCLTSLTQALHAAYLDKEFPETPKLLSDSAHVQWAAHAEYADNPSLFFVQSWGSGPGLGGLLFKIGLVDMFHALHDGDKEYWRSSREAQFGCTLEEYAGDQSQHITELRTRMLRPMRATVAKFPFLGGSQPNIADILVASLFLWIKSAVKAPLLEKDDPVVAWYKRICEHYAEVLHDRLAYPIC